MADWLSLSPAVRVLVLNGLAFNLGFYMLMPYLAQHLGADLGLAGWAVGSVMGMRVFSQQGLFLLGGWLGDRLWVIAAPSSSAVPCDAPASSCWAGRKVCRRC